MMDDTIVTDFNAIVFLFRSQEPWDEFQQQQQMDNRVAICQEL